MKLRTILELGTAGDTGLGPEDLDPVAQAHKQRQQELRDLDEFPFMPGGPGPHYRGYTIEQHYNSGPGAFTFAHEDFDGGPWEAGGPPMDPRHGTATSIEDAIEQIDEIELELEDDF